MNRRNFIAGSVAAAVAAALPAAARPYRGASYATNVLANGGPIKSPGPFLVGQRTYELTMPPEFSPGDRVFINDDPFTVTNVTHIPNTVMNRVKCVEDPRPSKLECAHRFQNVNEFSIPDSFATPEGERIIRERILGHG